MIFKITNRRYANLLIHYHAELVEAYVETTVSCFRQAQTDKNYGCNSSFPKVAPNIYRV